MPSSSSPAPEEPPAPESSSEDETIDSELPPSDESRAATLGAIQEPQRLHPLTLILRIGASLPALLVILFPTLQNPNSGNLISIFLTVLYGIVALPAIVLQYWRFSYRITPKQIVIQSGVLNRKNRSIPIERVQNIQIEQNLIARLFDIAKVNIETAGSSGTEGSIEYVRLDDAHEIRQVVRSFQHREHELDEDESAAPAEETAESLFSMSLPRVLLSGAFRFSLLYIALIFSALQFVDPDTLIDRFIVRQQVEEIMATLTAHPAVAILATIVVASLLGWISGILIHLARYYGFQLWMDGDKLRKRHGLFTVTEGTIPLKKVQALILHTNPFMRAFGWYQLEVQTIGMNVDEQGHRVIAPFAQYDRIVELAQRVRTFDLPETFGSVSMLTIRRRFLRYSMALTVFLLPAVYFWPAGWWHPSGVALPWWGFTLLPLLLGLAILQYHNHGYQTQTDGLYIRRGVLSHYLWILPLEKFHVFYTTASIFQRRLALKTLFVDTAGAASFAYPEVIDVPAAEAEAEIEQLRDQFQTLYHTRIEDATGDPDRRLAKDERPRLPTDDESS